MNTTVVGVDTMELLPPQGSGVGDSDGYGYPGGGEYALDSA